MNHQNAAVVIEPITDNLSVEYRPDGIMIYHLDSLHPDKVDEWIALERQHTQEAASWNFHVCWMLNLRRAGYPTAYLTSQIIELLEKAPYEIRRFASLPTNRLR